MRLKWWALCLANFWLSGVCARSPPVNVVLQASFNAGPYLIELLETAAQENATSYFPLLDRIADGYFKHASTDQELYESFLKLLKEGEYITDADAISSFKLALSLRSAAPRVEAHYQYYNTSIEPSLDAQQASECNTWVQFGGKQYCSPLLDEAHGQVSSSSTGELPFDRVFGDASTELASILYADITSPQFAKFHRTLIESAREGKTSYRVRYKPSPTIGKPLTVHGYGVELALKRTDYIVIDDRDNGDDDEKEVPKAEQTGDSTLQSDEEVADLKPLSTSELAGLGIKAASFIMNSDDPLETFLKLSKDFPKHSGTISARNASEEFVNEWKGNAAFAIPQGYNVIWINGVQIDPREMNPFSLLEHIRRERKLINAVRQLGFSGLEAINLLSHEEVSKAQADEEPQRYDFRDETDGGHVIMWMNDIEKDKRYQDWPATIQALIQPTFPGQLPTARRDIHNVIFPVDFSEPRDVTMVVETVQNLIKRKVPIRWGLVPLTHHQAAAEQARIVYHLLDTYGLVPMLSHLETALSTKQLSSADRSSFEATTSKYKVRNEQTPLNFQDVLQHELLAERIEKSRKYLKRLAADGPTAPLFVNGVPVTRGEEWLQSMSNRITLDLRVIQRGIFEGVFQEDSWLPSIFLFQAALRRNPLVTPEDEKTIGFCDMRSIWDEYGDVLGLMPRLSASETEDTENWAHLTVIGDFDTPAGARLLSEATKFRASHKNVEVIFVHNGIETVPASWAKRLLQLADGENGLEKDELERLSAQIVASAHEVDTEESVEKTRQAIRRIGFLPGLQGLVLNGRLVGPIPASMEFSVEDFESLLVYETSKRIGPALSAAKSLELSSKITSPLLAAKLSSIVASSMISDLPEGMFESMPKVRAGMFDKLNSTHSAIIKGDIASATIQIVASVDPASEMAQRWVPMLKVLSELSGVHLRLFVNPKQNLEELPVKRFYRYVLGSEPTFEEDGSVHNMKASFAGLPEEALLTMGMDVAASWLVAPKESVHDLDNIKLSLVKGHSAVEAVYELEHILIEGHSRDVTNGMAPRGAQLVLKTEKDPHVADTIIMANLGYFQFKANPGFYNIALRPGRSDDIFSIDSAGTMGYNPQPGDETTEIVLMSFQGTTLFPRLSRKPGKEEEDVLGTTPSAADEFANKATDLAEKLLSKVGLSGKAEEVISKGSKWWSSLVSSEGTTAVKTSAHADINIFSVASGHLYERMLNIMMLSVMKHTNHTVKFWFIEQFLSPSFKSFLPTIAAEYGFQYEMVTYKWPHWLRGQKEKQREIWGYKILFLDVLFPLDLDKVIFVDADQIVRTDMYELVTLDLKGAPYGFTPMCDSRTEMEGFRFWKQGYWEKFLKGLPYHISALYVVDLKRFRQIAAGDRLRQQYHQLSSDPNSLANLDQDLPNHMQVMIPIHSLPQEWLWCETWCSDESLKDAKTIDLCNNPLTKEPKLDRARRQVPEWTVYDEEIAGLARRKKETIVHRDEGAQAKEDASRSAEAAPSGGRKRDEL